MKTSDPRHLLLAGLIGFATAVPVILGIQGCADREPVKPVVVVPEEGERIVLIVHESASDTPEVSRMIVGLRNGEPAEYLKTKGHRLYLVDDDAVDMDGKPTPLVEKWRAQLADLKLPAVVILDGAESFIHGQELLTATPEAVLEILKAHGG